MNHLLPCYHGQNAVVIGEFATYKLEGNHLGQN